MDGEISGHHFKMTYRGAGIRIHRFEDMRMHYAGDYPRETFSREIVKRRAPGKQTMGPLGG